MKLELKIYKKDKKTVEKTYRANTVELSFGTVRTVMQVIKPEELDLNDEQSVGMALLNGWTVVDPLFSDIFPGMTSEELDRAKLPDMIRVVRQVFAYLSDEIGRLGDSDPN